MLAKRWQKLLCGALGVVAAVVLFCTVSTVILQKKARESGLRLSGSAPPVNAVLQAVKAEDSLAVLSAGAAQMVKVGQRFNVHRGGKFIGMIQVIKVYDDLAGARILVTQRGESMQPGDRRLSAACDPATAE